MQKRLLCVVCGALVCCLATPLRAQQRLAPHTIQFKGAPEYTTEELLSAAQLKPGTAMSSIEIDDHAKLLFATGVFESLGYKFNGQDLIYELKMNTQIYPLKYASLPPVPGLDPEAVLRARVPLYRGKVPYDSELYRKVIATLEEAFAAKGFPVKLDSVSNINPKTKEVVSFSVYIADPKVLVGPITVAASSEPPEKNVLAILHHLENSPYDAEGTPSQITTYLGNLYHDEGYLEAKIEPQRAKAATIDDGVLHVPFTVSIAPGLRYKLSAIRLDPKIPMAQKDFDRNTDLHSGDIAKGQRLTKCWVSIGRQYHNHGFMKASIHPEPAFDREHATVSYTVTAEPGPVYTMGKLTVARVSEDLRQKILAAWKIPAGETFDESALLRLFAIGDANPELSRVFARAHCRYTLTVNDNNRSVDVLIYFEMK